MSPVDSPPSPPSDPADASVRQFFEDCRLLTSLADQLATLADSLRDQLPALVSGSDEWLADDHNNQTLSGDLLGLAYNVRIGAGFVEAITPPEVKVAPVELVGSVQ